MPRTLGLDLGTNSVGWALVREDGDGASGAMEGCGVRVFEEAVDAKTGAPKNQARRGARLARRVLRRRARRRALLRKRLVEAGLLPAELAGESDLERSLNDLGDPYDLRKKALDETLEPHEIGRVLLHLCARRGFLSNRKTRWGALLGDPDAKDLIDEMEKAERERKADAGKSAKAKEEEKEQGKVIAELADLWNAMKAAGARTLGEYLAGLPEGERKRERHTDRQMHEEEFGKVWAAQAERHPMLTEELRKRLFGTIFHQRALKLRGGRIGTCSFEPLRPRAAKARLESQRFRLLQDVNHLDAAGIWQDDYSLACERRKVLHPVMQAQLPPCGSCGACMKRKSLADALETQGSMTWGGIRKLFGFPRNVKFNLEEGSKEKGLTGNRTAARLRGLIPGRWDAMDDSERKRLVEDLLTIENKRALFHRLWEKRGFEKETALRLAVAEFEDGYASHSLKAMNRILPHLERGMIYSDARKVAGYGYEAPEAGDAELLGAPPADLRNPVVERALHELRRVVNAVIRQHGKPDVIRVELARDLKMTSKDKANFQRVQRENQKMNEEAKAELAKIGVAQPSRDDQLKYRLWRECGGECPYTGKTISIHELFSGDVDVEHIVPYSRCFDDSFLNKTLCLATENRRVKRNKTPWEAYGDSARWEEILQRVRGWPEGKSKRRKLAAFAQEKVDALDDFVSRQLNDTGYISRASLAYLKTLGADVQVSKGRPTAMLRRFWGLNRILAGDSPDAAAVAEKNRADHRHHALDAAVIAVTDRSLYQRLSRIAERNESAGLDPILKGPVPDLPWGRFARDVEDALSGVAVSHAPLRKLSGALHEDTAYGLREARDDGTLVVHYRKRLEDLTDAMADKIVDPALRAAVKERIERAGGIKSAFADLRERPLRHPTNPVGRPVRHVRIQENKSAEQLFAVDSQRTRSGAPFKYHAYGNNHHVEIFRNEETGKIEARFVTMMEAAARARRRKTPIVDREWEGREFLMSLAINDMVELDEDGTESLYRVQRLEAPAGLELRHHQAATLSNRSEQVRVVISKLVCERKMRKVNVSPIGELRNARD